MLFLPFAIISSELYPLSVISDTANTKQHGIYKKAFFQTNLHGMKCTTDYLLVFLGWRPEDFKKNPHDKGLGAFFLFVDYIL